MLAKRNLICGQGIIMEGIIMEIDNLERDNRESNIPKGDNQDRDRKR